MTQPAAINGAVAKPNSSAPSSAPISTSRPVRSPPSTCTAMRPRRRLSTSVCCVSASPISQGEPACLIEVSGEAPVPPSKPADGHMVGPGLGDARGNRADSDLGAELDADPGFRVDVFQIEDELRRDPRWNRCRDAAAARSGPRPASNALTFAMVSSTLWPGSWPPSPGLAPCTILICIMSELTRYSVVTPKRPDATCLIERAHAVAVRQRLEAIRLLAAFAGIGLAANPVHGDGESWCAPHG